MNPSRQRRKRLLIVLIPILAVPIWDASQALGRVVNLRAFLIPAGSNSMAPSILPGDRILVEISARNPQRGEIWLYQNPAGTTIIKRVIGLPGETVEVSGGKVSINGKPLDEPYLAAPTPYVMAPVMLGRDQYWVLGDSRAGSADSHATGPVEARQLVGKATTRVWPRQRIGSVR